MIRKLLTGVVLAAAVCAAAASLAAEDPTLQQVYAAAQAGHLSDAHAMMAKVLHDHPNSAKAHFVDAEILAKEGLISGARTELSTAERLAPGLPFAKPQAVDALRNRVTSSHAEVQHPLSGPAVQAAPSGGIPWGLIVLIALIAAVIYFAMAMRRRNATYIPAGGGAAYLPGAGGTMPAYGPGGMVHPMGPMNSGGGIGSGIMGGLATGAAVGAGMVAGEALMHHFTDGHRSDAAAPLSAGNNWAPIEPTTSYDMGGSDFGVADSSSWDDNSGGGGGGDDWG